MINRLSIRNYAIIDDLEIDFSGELNAITGETGAGKSIIVGALGLILGDRADTGALVNKGKKCFVEGTFGIKNNREAKGFLAKNEFDDSDELIIRREIGVNGKSRAFVNDSPVALSQLTEVSSLLVDLHRQFDTLQLGNNDFQREVLDALAGHGDLLSAYQALFQSWQVEKKEWELLQAQKHQFEKEFDYNQFQYNELDEAGFSANELEELESELKLLNNAEGIKAVLSKVYNDLEESEVAIVSQLKILLNQLQAYSDYHHDLPTLVERLRSAQIELQDIADETERICDHVNYDPKKIEQVQERLSGGYRLLKKHGVKSTNELLEIRDQLGEKLQAVFNIDEQLRQREKQMTQSYQQAYELATKISGGRKKQVRPFEDKVNKLLGQVGMPNAVLRIEIKEKANELGFFGFDAIEFLFDANKSGQFQPVRKVASGGELSRLMLCIKSLVAQSIDLPTMIFDEIDTGISGEAARQVGLIMKGLARKRQVICITHQPQIAGKADAHFFVYKQVVEDAVKTHIRRLSTDERITTIAKMMSGEKPTAAAMENAREMIVN